jgi:hypothetical protein
MDPKVPQNITSVSVEGSVESHKHPGLSDQVQV